MVYCGNVCVNRLYNSYHNDNVDTVLLLLLSVCLLLGQLTRRSFSTYSPSAFSSVH